MTPSGWQTGTIGELSTLLTGGTPSRQRDDFWDGDIPWMSSGEIHQKRVAETRETITDAGLAGSNARWIPEGAVMVALNGQGKTRGTVAVLTRRMTCNQSLAAILPRQDALVTDYLFQYLSAKYDEIRRLTGAGGRNGLNLALIRSIRVACPPLAEQRTIAAILSSVDDAIEKTQAVIDQVQVVKRGLMQELLTRGLPGRHTRFKQTEIGEMPKGWESAPLGSRAELQPGFAFKSRDFSAGGDRLLRGSNVGIGRLVWTEGKTEYFPSERRAEVEDYELRDGDIVVAMDRPFVSDGFKVARVTADDLPTLLLQRVGRFRRYRGLMSGYLWHLLQSGYVQGHLQIAQKGTDLPHISKTEIESSICPLPPIDEQESIATFLDTLDVYSTRLEKERRQATKLKTGLMSVLLTGELRVTPDTEAA